METLDFLSPLLANLGPAALAFGIMYLWLRKEQETSTELRTRNVDLQNKIDQLNGDRIAEMKAQIAAIEEFNALIRRNERPPT